MASPLFPSLAEPSDRRAIAFGRRALSFAELAAACRRHVATLAESGIHRGDRVGVWTHPSLEAVVALVAHASAGIVTVPLNPHIGERELQHVIATAAPRCVLARDATTARDRTPATDVRAISLSTTARSTEPKSSHPSHAALRADDPLLILFTSGTTGAPKGAVLTAGNIASNLDALAAAWAWTPDDVLVHALPLFHVHGLVLGLLGALRVGASLAWLARFSPEDVCAAFDRGATMLFAVPTMIHRIAEHAERNSAAARALARARLLVSGSAALPVREHQRIERLCGQRVVERYGLTETIVNCAVRADGDRRAGYVGAALEGVEVKLVDDARNTIDARDDATMGEIAVRGPNVFAGYLQRQDATDAVRDRDGWFYTGDLATIARDGYVRIVGRRATDLIKTGGFKVGAGEIESALLECDGVLDAAVIGVPDDDLGERIVAFVVLRENSARPESRTLIDHVASTTAVHKRPRELHFVDELPRNAMGKVIKSALAKSLAVRG